MNSLILQTMRVLFPLVLGWIGGGTAYAQSFSGPSFFSQPPSTQLGNLTNNLILQDTPNGFIVSGNVTITVPQAPKSGTLVTWEVARPLSPGNATNVFTTTSLQGFSSPPTGTFGNTFGTVESSVTGVGGPSISTIPLALVNGVDSPPWGPTAITVNSGFFNYTSPPAGTLKQRFTVDGVYLTGSGGTWTVDVPVSTFLNPTSAPSPVPSLSLWGLTALTVLIIGSGITLMRRRQRSGGTAGPVV